MLKYLFEKRFVFALDTKPALDSFKDVESLVNTDKENWKDAITRIDGMKDSAEHILAKKKADALVKLVNPGNAPTVPPVPGPKATDQEKSDYKAAKGVKDEYDKKKSEYDKEKRTIEIEFSGAMTQIGVMWEAAKIRVGAARQARMDAEQKVKDRVLEITSVKEGFTEQTGDRAKGAADLLVALRNQKGGGIQYQTDSTIDGRIAVYRRDEIESVAAGLLASVYDPSDQGKKAQDLLAGFKKRGDLMESGFGIGDLLAVATQNMKNDRTPAGKDAKELAKEILKLDSAAMPPQLRGMLIGELSKSTPGNRAMIVARIKQIKDNYKNLKGKDFHWNDNGTDQKKLGKTLSIFNQLEEASLLGEFSSFVVARYNNLKTITGKAIPSIEAMIAESGDDPEKIRANESKALAEIGKAEDEYKTAKSAEIKKEFDRWKALYDFCSISSPFSLLPDWDKGDLTDFQSKYQGYKSLIEQAGKSDALKSALESIKSELNVNIKKISDYAALYNRAVAAGIQLDTSFPEIKTAPALITASTPEAIMTVIGSNSRDSFTTAANKCEAKMKELNDALKAKGVSAGGTGTGGGRSSGGGVGGGNRSSGGNGPSVGPRSAEKADGIKVEARDPYDPRLPTDYVLNQNGELKDSNIPSWAKEKEAEIKRVASVQEAKMDKSKVHNNTVEVRNTDGTTVLAQVNNGTIYGYYKSAKPATKSQG